VREAGRRGVDPLVDSRRINLARTTSSAGALTLLGAGHALEQAGEAPYDLGCGAPLQRGEPIARRHHVRPVASVTAVVDERATATMTATGMTSSCTNVGATMVPHRE